MANYSKADIDKIIQNQEATEKLVEVADNLGRELKDLGLTTAQIRALFGEVRQIQAQWSIRGQEDRALRRFILLKPKMAYRARRERGQGVRTLVEVLTMALDAVISGGTDKKEKFDRFVEFFEAILAYHKSYGGN
ncbi:MAG TPA: type III-A CRISPR-associated protein Csm2 [Anaerolineaceae bacterium]|nr:type III-A CRISPR-associated protein Csm2 [Anaerolineaceae bacterium]HOH21250.1 type III-A CRISPR-associated protein Csm2 [Anaerolineaceae bacterium]